MYLLTWLRAFAPMAIAGLILPMTAHAEEVWITPEIPEFEFSIGDQDYVIRRNQDTEAVIEGSFAKTSRKCPPFCVHPMKAAEGVETIGEVELLNFMVDVVEAGDGLLIDARLMNWYEKGTIPGAVNVPFNLFNPNQNPFFDGIMRQLGGRLLTNGAWNFESAKTLALFCNGAWCDQSPRAIRNLVSVGYPPEKLRYYRGGMQSWLMMGFPTVKPAGV